VITAATNTSSAVEPGHESPTDQGALIVNNIPNRSTEMLLMHEELARAHNQARFEERLRHERSLRVVRAHRAQRRAEHAVVRARHLLSLASAY
jgi:hypothetical protein